MAMPDLSFALPESDRNDENILNAAADLIEKKGLAKYLFVADYDGSHCVMGALAAVMGIYNPWQETEQLSRLATLIAHNSDAELDNCTEVPWLAEWNNATERTSGEVVCALRQAANSLSVVAQ